MNKGQLTEIRLGSTKCYWHELCKHRVACKGVLKFAVNKEKGDNAKIVTFGGCRRGCGCCLNRIIHSRQRVKLSPSIWVHRSKQSLEVINTENDAKSILQ